MSLPKLEQIKSTIEEKPKIEQMKINTRVGLLKGVILTLILAMVAGSIARLPFFSIMGIMIISILLGMSWKALMDVPANSNVGITFSSKILLRAGIILMGLRLNFSQIVEAGFSIVLVDVLVIAFTLTVMIAIGHALKVDKYLTALIAVGTAVCGAAAIVAVAPLIHAKKEFTAVSVACIAILGTIGTIFYTFLFPYLGLDSYQYGVLVGATLHELAHVIAAAIPGGDTSGEIAILVKLGRVALLIPVAMILGYFYTKKERTTKESMGIKDLPIPWFIFGFLAMCLVNTVGILSTTVTQFLIASSVFLLSMAMAGLGLSINFSDFKKVGFRAILVGIIGFILLTAISPLLLKLV
ncbi:YeiH family putative sulfate export transporter [Ammoniphilus sp. CFH 90114]|nr:YeiH family putative sulfate export transporter [Ammoniphilus sp. CFH 90114]